MISTIFEFITKIIVWIVKSIAEMVSFFLRLLFNIFRLVLTAIPITGSVFTCFFIMLILSLISGNELIPPDFPVSVNSEPVRDVILKAISSYLSYMSAYDGKLLYFVLAFFGVILFIPMLCIFLAFGTVSYAGKYLAMGVIADCILYILGTIFLRRAPYSMILRRFKYLFPSAGKKIDQRSYDRWLRRHNRDFDDDSFGRPSSQGRDDEFYDDEDEYYENEDYYNDEDKYYDEDDHYIEDRHHSKPHRRRYVESYDEDDEDYDDYDDDRDDYDDYYDDRDDHDDYEDDDRDYSRRSSRPASNTQSPVGAFNFFSGCNTLESADRKYKSLVKLYHPDNMDGDTAALQEINVQYSKIKKKFS